MNDYNEGDMVVMNMDLLPFCRANDEVTYVKPSIARKCSILKNIYGDDISVPNHSFDLLDNPKFEFDELIEVSNHEDFELVDEMYFVADISKMGKFDRPCNIVAMTDDGCIRIYPYARKITTVNLIIEGKTHKVTQEVRDAYVVALKAVMNDD